MTRWLLFDSRTRESNVDMIEGTIKRAQEEPRTEYYLAVTIGGDELVGFARLGLTGVQAASSATRPEPTTGATVMSFDATRTLVHFGFTTLRLHRISAAIGPDN